MTAPLLVIAWGNRSRGDDALGPLFVDRLQHWAATGFAGAVDFIEDQQLQPEHALDLCGRHQVLFVDASVDVQAPCSMRALAPRRDTSLTSHALSPEAVLEVFRDIRAGEPPRCVLLAIRGHDFELGAPPSAAALRNLDEALQHGRRWLADAHGVESITQPPQAQSVGHV